MKNKIRILVLGTRGAARAPVALGWFESLLGERVTVSGAALSPEPVHPLAREVMAERGVTLSEGPLPSLAELPRDGYDLVISLVDPAEEATDAPDEGERADSLHQLPWPWVATLEERRPLLVGDPVPLEWQLDDPLAAAEQGEEALGEAFEGLAEELGERVAALTEQGYLEVLVRQRRRTHLYLDALQEGIVAHDENRCICVFNRAAEKITGMSRDDVLGGDCHEVFAPDGLCGSECLFAGGPAKIPSRRQYQMTFTNKRGEDKRLKMDVRPLDLGAGRYQGVIAVMHDITEVSELRWQVSRRRGFHGLVGASEPMQDVFDTIRQVSPSDYPVLITGESGTGKELAARAIHAESRRARGPFVPINCGALPENILESELFGHVRGAFTGAIRDKKGRFELAHKGTLFLDEVGELTPAFQVKLLRVLQEKRFEPVGGERSVNVDVRIISATNRELKPMVGEGEFREDLYYRLCVVPIVMPPLRRRREDLPHLVEHFLATIRKETGKPLRGLTNEAMDLIVAHPWPGNVRELINALQFAAVRCDGEVLEPAHLPPEVRKSAAEQGVSAGLPLASSPRSAGGGRYKLDRRSVERALADAGGNKVQAAKILGVGRATLYRFLNRENVST